MKDSEKLSNIAQRIAFARVWGIGGEYCSPVLNARELMDIASRVGLMEKFVVRLEELMSRRKAGYDIL